jgi:hypothetical protein
VTVIDIREAGVTVTVVDPTTVPSVADTVAVPVLRAVTTPAAVTVATAGFELAQVTDEVRSAVVPSL